MNNRRPNPLPIAVRKLKAHEMRAIIHNIAQYIWVGEDVGFPAAQVRAVANLLELYNLKPKAAKDATDNPK